jgi:hypothetical protein
MEWITRLAWLAAGLLVLGCAGLMMLHVLVTARLAGW